MLSSDVPLLCVTEVTAGYGQLPVVREASMTIRRGETVAVLGHNGAGKSTLIKALIGRSQVFKGLVTFQGKSIGASSLHTIRSMGIAYLSQGGRVFGTLSVEDNLRIAHAVHRSDQEWAGALSRVLAIFPELSPRISQPALRLSGGERQMLALASCLLSPSTLLLLDEPMNALSPVLRQRFLRNLAEIVQETNCGCIVIEQNVNEILTVAKRAIVLRNGQVAFDGESSHLTRDLLRTLLIISS